MSKQVHVLHNSVNNEWYTPQIYIDAARSVMGSIDLDPATSVTANIIVNASKFYTIDSPGIQFPWCGNVWLNPPYSRGDINLFVNKFISELELGNIKSGIVLVNNATETKWGNKLLMRCDSVCFVSRRIKFLNEFLEVSTKPPIQSQMFVYFGTDRLKFINTFSKFGACFNR